MNLSLSNGIIYLSQSACCCARIVLLNSKVHYNFWISAPMVVKSILKLISFKIFFHAIFCHFGFWIILTMGKIFDTNFKCRLWRNNNFRLILMILFYDYTFLNFRPTSQNIGVLTQKYTEGSVTFLVCTANLLKNICTMEQSFLHPLKKMFLVCFLLSLLRKSNKFVVQFEGTTKIKISKEDASTTDFVEHRRISLERLYIF